MMLLSLYTRLLLIVTVFALSACVQVIDATTKGPIDLDPGKRTLGGYVDDKQLKTVVGVNLRKASPELEKAHISVESFNNVILLTGEVPNKTLRDLATQTARNVHKVRQVHNELAIQSNTSFFSRTNDNWLHAKIRTKLLANKKIKSKRVKVVVQNRVVYLMGLLSQEETDLITAITSRTKGVEKVVRAIEYID